MTTHAARDARLEDAIGAPPQRPTLVPAERYYSPAFAQLEVERMWPKVWQVACTVDHVAEPGDYFEYRCGPYSLLIVRGDDGTLRAFQNVCRHRGGELVPEGTGKANRLTCPYHAWSYDLKGCLVGVYGEETFGGVDRETNSLFALPAAERAGLVFVSLDPKATIDLDQWLGAELITLLEAMALDQCFHYSTRTLAGPNWKVVIDGYLEGYHFASLHRTTVFRTNLSNMAAFDSWGPHQRNSFALRPIAHAVDLPREQWDPALCVGAIYWLFPGLAVAGGWRSQVVVSLVLPGTSWDTSQTQQILALRHQPADDDERKAAEHTRDWFHDVVMDEDYATGFGVQRGLAAVDGQDFTFGRNEPGVQHFHRVLKEMLA